MREVRRGGRWDCTDSETETGTQELSKLRGTHKLYIDMFRLDSMTSPHGFLVDIFISLMTSL